MQMVLQLTHGALTFVHLTVYHVLRRGIWLRLVELAKAAPDSYGLGRASVGLSFVLLGTTVDGRLLPPGLLAFWIVLWKFVILRFTQVDLDNTAFQANEVWVQALRRLVVRVHAVAWKYKFKVLTAHAQDIPSPSPTSTNRMLAPIAEVDMNGALSWAPFMEAALKEAGIEVPRPKPQSPRPPEAKIEQTVADYLRKHKISFSKEQDHAGEPPEREYVPLVKEVPRYVWLLQRWLLVRKVKGVVTLYSRFRMYGTPEVHRIEAGAPLPLVCNHTEDKTIDEVYAASCKVGEALAVVQSRAQALVFEVNCDMERATEYVWQSCGTRDGETCSLSQSCPGAVKIEYEL